MKRFPFVALPIVLLFGCAVRPGGAPAGAQMGVGQIAAPIMGAAAGAAIGKNTIGGDTGAAIGAAAGALAGSVTANVSSDWYATQMAEAKEQAARQERVKVMQDYWESHAINGGNGPRTTHPNGGPAPTSEKMTYPAGVYDGVLYGPREVDVPARSSVQSNDAP